VEAGIPTVGISRSRGGHRDRGLHGPRALRLSRLGVSWG
jgi:hypothetical protein